MSDKSKSPAFQFYVNDWLGSKQIMLMTPEEEGAYIRLLAYAWPDGLNDDDEELSILSRLGPKWFEGSGEKIRKCFEKIDYNGVIKLHNKRLIFENKKQKKFAKNRSEAGKKGMEKRWKKQKTVKEKLHSIAKDKQMP